ncbi:MAG: sodium-dependent bicarbonate transport family permease, partial [Actinomycetales bacterium]|nr:sodium-dependent bicarbonate transport family permease [Actinomycetales bacterium]
LQLPDAVYQGISMYLLFGIGLKGGVQLDNSNFGELSKPLVATVLLGIVIPVVAFFTLRFITKIDELNRGAIAAHYGSTSLVTFTAALLFLEANQIEYNGYAATLLTVMEIPGLVVGIYLGSRHLQKGVSWGESIKEIVLGKTVLLMAGGLLVGAISGEKGYVRVAPFFDDLKQGMLALFLLHLGYLAGSQFKQVREAGALYIGFALLFPVLTGTVGVLAGQLTGMSLGGAVLLGILCASASYIAAPAAVGVALPDASKSLPILASLGVTFPFNLILGIPYLYWLATLIFG